MNNDIWVWAEHDQGEVRESSLELLGEARRLAKSLGGEVRALLLGSGIGGLTDDLVAYGADVVHVFEDARLAEYSTDLYAHAFAALKAERTPALLLIGSTPNGCSLAPRLSARFGCGFVAGAVTIGVQPDGRLKITRSMCLDKAHGVLTFPLGDTIVITMKPGSIGLDRADRKRTGEVIAMELRDAPPSMTAVEGFVKADPKVVALDEAERVVAAGAGFKSKEELDVIWDLSEAVGAAVGGSKPVVDYGWLPRTRLVGQSSGRRISARLFIGAGVSGTSYFTEGMKDSRVIIAINTDKGAPLMKLADLAVVGDIHEVIPELARQVSAWREEAV